MADVNKTIEISMKADLKQLLTQFKKMPGITEKEAKKMVSGLQKELRQAQKAAEKTAKITKQSMKQVEISSKKASHSVRGLRRQTRELGGSFNAMGDVMEEVNPEFAQFSQTAEIAGAGFRSFSRILATGNPMLIAAVAAIVAAGAAYAFFTRKANASKKAQEELESILTETTSKIMEQQQAADDAADSMLQHASAANQSALDLQVMNGVLSESDLSMLKLEKQAGDMRQAIVDNSNEQVTSLKKVVDNYKAQETGVKNNLKFLEKEGLAYKKVTDGIFSTLEQTKQYSDKQRELRVLTVAREEAEEKLQKAQEETANLADTSSQRFFEIEKEKLKIREQEKKSRERQKKQQEEQREEQKKALKIQRAFQKEASKLITLTDKLADSRKEAAKETFSLEIENRQKSISLMENEQEKLQESFQLQKDLVDNKALEIKDEIKQLMISEEERKMRIKTLETMERTKQQENELISLRATAQTAQMDALLTIEEKEQQLILLGEKKLLLEQEQAKQKEELSKKLIMQTVTEANAIGSVVVGLAKSTGQLIQNLSEKDKEAAMTQFRISQGVAIAEIIMSTAKNVAASFPNPIMMTAAGALGAVQLGVVATTPPPEFHMGGMINKGPDTQVITALKGEGIIDRSTMKEIGGEQGLRRLKSGSMNNQEVIVRTPFKHFDNYSKVSIKRNGALSRLQRTRSVGVY